MRAALDLWFSKAKRSFPWRNTPTPYMVLVSEIMLQQTQASRVLSFFPKWMHLFPSIEALAQAPEETVIKAWEGLGYYSRARSLHRAAKTIAAEHKGSLPHTKQALLLIPGIGPYTAGAILSFAFHKRALAIDANVERVVRRLCQISYADKNARLQIEAFVDSVLPRIKPWHTMEALIELGALVCQKKPSCSTCPISTFCSSHKNGVLEQPPPKQKTLPLFRDVACIISHEKVLVVHRTGKQIMSGLYEFPFFDSVKGGKPKESFHLHLEPQIPAPITFQEKLPCIIHTFTRFRSFLYPWIIFCPHTFAWPDGKWIHLDELFFLPFSSGHKKIAAMLNDHLP
jgi:A/G-specific adenine glycosylase